MRFLAVLASSLLVANSAHAFMIRGSTIGFGVWSGGAYADDSSGIFSHCVASASYNSGDMLHLTIDRSGTFILGISTSNFGFVPGEEFRASVYIDRAAPFSGVGVALSSSIISFSFRNAGEIIPLMQYGRVMRVQGARFAGEYNLTGTMRVLPEIARCAQVWIGVGATTPPAPPTTNLAALPPRPRPNIATQSSASVDRSVLYQIATEMISQLNLTDFRYLSDSFASDLVSVPSVFFSAREGAVIGGTFFASAERDATLRESDARDTAILSGVCDGDLAISFVNVGADEGNSRQVRGVCVTNESTVETLMTKTLVGELMLYTLISFDQSNSETDGRAASIVSQELSLRAASYIPPGNE
ncbi:hypothetical protein [Pararhodobacter sp.]|uniref:hypothetical protein n=1 Tax=Pararhodobacter sp. TaxID=2127056 RepID=UPI002AFF82D6|nr:hypothetical protein [Pararhodobacter sp.]